jgi:hypothetical protein
MVESPSPMVERGLPSWNGTSPRQAISRHLLLVSSEGSMPFQYTNLPRGVDVIIRPC